MNQFIDDQKAMGEKGATLKMVFFNTQYSISYDGKLKKAPKFSLDPCGMTALYDAVGHTLGTVEVGDDPLIIIILTDGYENSSREWTKKGVFDLIQRLDANDNVSITYLGANQDAMQVGHDIGVSVDSTLDYGVSVQEIQAANAAMTTNVLRARDGGTIAYSEGDRAASKRSSE